MINIGYYTAARQIWIFSEWYKQYYTKRAQRVSNYWVLFKLVNQLLSL